MGKDGKELKSPHWVREALMCFCLGNGGIRRTTETRYYCLIYLLYWAYHLDQLVYLVYSQFRGFNLRFNEWSLQIGWPNAKQQLSTRGMLYPSHQYWADWRLCLWVNLAPFHIPCARRPAPFREQHVTSFALKWANSQ